MQHPLENYRKERGKTQKELAEALGCAQSTYNAYVKALRFPPPSMLAKISAETGASVTAADMLEAWQKIRRDRVNAA